MVVQLFMSHTKLDRDFCNRFDIVAVRVGVKVFRSEFEEIKPPAWKTIKDQMDVSSAMFLLVGEQLVKAQAASEKDPKLREEWKHTQNWIAYEIGLACERGIDVWVYCDSVKINFPVPYLNNYAIYGINLESPTSVKWIRGVFEEYNKGHRFSVGLDKSKICTCPYKNCQSVFNLHSVIQKDEEVPCPTCLKDMVFTDGWLLDP